MGTEARSEWVKGDTMNVDNFLKDLVGDIKPGGGCRVREGFLNLFLQRRRNMRKEPVGSKVILSKLTKGALAQPPLEQVPSFCWVQGFLSLPLALTSSWASSSLSDVLRGMACPYHRFPVSLILHHLNIVPCAPPQHPRRRPWGWDVGY